jgi:hypothetical protein
LDEQHNLVQPTCTQLSTSKRVHALSGYKELRRGPCRGLFCPCSGVANTHCSFLPSNPPLDAWPRAYLIQHGCHQQSRHRDGQLRLISQLSLITTFTLNIRPRIPFPFESRPGKHRDGRDHCRHRHGTQVRRRPAPAGTRGPLDGLGLASQETRPQAWYGREAQAQPRWHRGTKAATATEAS